MTDEDDLSSHHFSCSDPAANSSINDGSEEEVQGDGEGLSPVFLVGAVVGLLLLGAGGVLMLRGRDGSGVSALPATNEPEPPEHTGGTGLLARAERLK